MKIKLDKNYMKKISYTALGFTIIYIVYMVLSGFGQILQTTYSALNYLLKILTPLTIGLIIAYLFMPIAKYIEEKVLRFKANAKLNKSKRMVSTLLTYIIVVIVVTIAIYSVVIMIGGKVKDVNYGQMVQALQAYVDKFSNNLDQLLAKLEYSDLSEQVINQIKNLSSNFKNVFNNIVNGFVGTASSIGGYVIDLAAALFISFYIIKDREHFAKLWNNALKLLLPKKAEKEIRNTLKDIDKVISNFVRGQVIDLTILGILTSIALKAIGYEFAFVIGMIAGYANIIPYLGPWIGAVPAVFVGLLGIGGGPMFALKGVIVMFVVQQVDSYTLSPKIVGDSIGIHPVFVLLSIIVFGSTMGLKGMILAIPIAGIINIFVKRFVEYRKNKLGIELEEDV